MGWLKNPTRGRQPGTAGSSSVPQSPTPTPSLTSQSQPPVQPDTDDTTTSSTTPPPVLNRVQSGNISLVTYSPEESLMQVQEARDKVAFGQSPVQSFMANFTQYWSLIGPFLFAIGTIGEIFLVLWERQIKQSYFAGFVIIIVSVIAEGGLLAVSFSSKLLRNRADKRPSGWTPKEVAKLKDIKVIWWLLSVGVAATQVAFVMSQTKSDDIGGPWGLVAIALVRSAVALVADYYTAYISEEKQTSAEMALEIQDQQTAFTDKMLSRKETEITILNNGSIRVQDAAQKAALQQERNEAQAEMDRDTMRTERELLRLENENKIEKMKSKFAEESAWSQLQIASTRAMQAKITQITVEHIEGGGDSSREVTSTLQHLLSEVKELKGQSTPNDTVTAPLRVVNGYSEEED